MPVPKSGRASAVILYLETTSGYPPLTLATSPNYNIGITGSNPGRAQKVLASKGMQMKASVKPLDKEIAGDFDVHRIVLDSKTYDGQYPFVADPENLYLPLLSLFGVDLQATIVAGAYTHAFQPNKRRGYVPSLTIEEIFGDAVYGRLTSGTVVQKLEFSFGEVVQCTMTLYGAHQTPNNYPLSGVRTKFDYGSTANILPTQMGGNGTNTVTRTATPSFVDVPEPQDGDGPLTFGSMTYGTQGGQFASNFITIDGVGYAAEILKGSTLTIEHVMTRQQVAGQDFDVSTFIAHEWTVSGKLDMLFTDDTIPIAYSSKSQIGLNFQLVGPQIAATAHNYALEVFIPNFNFLDSPLEIPTSEMMVGGAFYAKQDPTAAQSILITLTNSVTNASLAGQQIVTTAAIVNNVSATISVNNSIGILAADTISISGGVTSNPYTVLSVTATSITFTGMVQGTAAIGATVTVTNRPFGQTQLLGGWNTAP